MYGYERSEKSKRRDNIISAIDITVLLLIAVVFFTALGSVVKMVENFSFSGAPLTAFLICSGILGVIGFYGWLINR